MKEYIPRIIHKIWIQGGVPEKHKKHYKKCQEINNNFKHILWQDDSIRKLIRENGTKTLLEVYDNAEHMAHKADIARILIVYVYGGIYIDMDSICYKNLSPLLHHKFFISKCDEITELISGTFSNGVIGAVPRHIFLKNMLDYIQNQYLSGNTDLLNQSGTGAFKKSILKTIEDGQEEESDLVRLPYKMLNPCSMLSSAECPYESTNSYIAQCSDLSWSPVGRTAKKIINFIHNYKLLILLILFAVGYKLFSRPKSK